MASGHAALPPPTPRAEAARRTREATRAQRLARAQSADARTVQAQAEVTQLADASRRMLRTWRNEAHLNQAQAADAISTLIPPGIQGWMMSHQIVSRMEVSPERMAEWTLRQLFAARTALGQSLSEWGSALERAVDLWKIERGIAVGGADARALARRQLAEEAQARVHSAMPRLTIQEQQQVALIVETMARSHGYAGHTTPQDALVEGFARLDALAAEHPAAPPSLPPGDEGAER